MADLPPKKTDTSLVEPLLQPMSEIRIDWDVWRAYNKKLQGRPSAIGDELPAGYIGTAKALGEEAFIVANGVYGPLTPGVPSNGPVDVRFNMSMHFTESDALELVRRLITRRDKPEIDHLIIHAGAPDVDGWSYPAEGLLAAFIMEKPNLVVQAEHLKQVTLHLWQPAVIAVVPLRSMH